MPAPPPSPSTPAAQGWSLATSSERACGSVRLCARGGRAARCTCWRPKTWTGCSRSSARSSLREIESGGCSLDWTTRPAPGERAKSAISLPTRVRSREELVEQLAGRGLRLAGQARPHLIAYAALQGILCLGPDRGSKPTYVLLDDWIDRASLSTLSREAACVELKNAALSTVVIVRAGVG
jgi:hypothetical protein